MSASRGVFPALLSAALCTVAIAGWSGEKREAAEAAGATMRSGHANLRVLPHDIGKPQLGALMRGYERDLGVECSYCHVEDRDTGKLDYAAEDNPKKEIARVMIAMLEDINNRHLAALGGDARYATPVTCGSCHLGRANPPAFEGRR